MLQVSEPGLSDAGDRNVVSVVNSNSSVFLSEPCAKLVLFLLPGHSESLRFCLPSVVFLKKSAASLQPALILKHFLRYLIPAGPQNGITKSRLLVQ